MVDEPPVSLTTLRMPPLPFVGVEEDRQQVVQAARRQRRRHLERVGGEDVHALVEEAVAAHPVPVEARHRVGDLERGVAVDAGSLRPRGLARRVVRHLVLEEDDPAAVAVPDHLGLLVVLDEQAVRGDVVAVDDHAGVGGVDGPADAVAVVGPPGPDVVEDDVVAVDLEADASPCRRSAPPIRKNTSCSAVGSAGVARCERAAVPTCEQHRRVHRAGVEHEAGELSTPGTSATVIAASPCCGHSVGKPRPSTTVSGALDLDRLVEVVDARREDQVLAPCERAVDLLRGVARLGEVELVERDRRAGRRPAAPRSVPTEFVARAGTKTL